MNPFPASNLLLTGIFLFCLATLAAGALLAVFSARLIRSVSGLAVCSIGLAGLYYFLHSPFLALMEILIYIGAVCVTIVFAIMLAEPEEPPNEEKPFARIAWGGLALGSTLALFCAVVWLGTQREWAAPATLVNEGSIASIGVSLLTTYSLAFELISLALLVAILGALAIARTGRANPLVTTSPVPLVEPEPVVVPGTGASRPYLDETEIDEPVGLPKVLTTTPFQRSQAESDPALDQSRIV